MADIIGYLFLMRPITEIWEGLKHGYNQFCNTGIEKDYFAF